jgi:hypothetical protein
MEIGTPGGSLVPMVHVNDYAPFLTAELGGKLCALVNNTRLWLPI